MDPFSLMIQGGMTALSIGTSIIGGSKASQGASAYYAAQKQQAALEMKADAQRRQAMELDSNRKSMEVLRNSQRARATATQAATSQGAQFGSGLQGGYGQISGSTNVNQLGIAQDKQIGENLFDINAQINQQKMAMSDAQSMMYQGQAMQSLGKNISSAMPGISSLGKDFFGGSGGMFGGSPGGKGITPW